MTRSGGNAPDSGTSDESAQRQRQDRGIAVVFSKNVFGYGAGLVLSRAVTLVAVIVLARLLSVPEFGRFSVILAGLAIAEIATVFGIDRLAVREVARDPTTGWSRVPEFLNLGSTVVLVGVVASLGLAWLVVGSGQALVLISLAGLALLPITLAAILDGAFQGHQKMLLAGAGLVLGSVIWLAVISVVPLLELGLEEIVFGIFVAHLMRFAFLAWHAPRSLLRMPRPTAWRSIWHESAPFAISAGLGVLLVRQDLLLLAWLRGEVEAGVYSVAFKFAEMALYLSMVGLVALVPIVAALHADPRQLRLAYLTALKAATTVAFPLAILVFVNREFLITFLFADAYAAAVPLLAVLSVLMGIYVVHAPSMAMLLAGTRRRPLVVVPVAAIAVSLLINLILIPFLGSMGAAIAALSAMTIAAGLAMRYALRSVGLTALETLRVVSPPGVLGATMLALFLAFSAGRVSELIATPIGLCIYLGIAYAVDTRMSGGSLFERLTGRSGATIAERGR